MFNGGLQARNQGQIGTCYSESTTRLILKLLKHPDIKLLGDIRTHEKFKKLQEFEDLIVNEIKDAPNKIIQKKEQIENNNYLIEFINEFLKNHRNPQSDTNQESKLTIQEYFPNEFKIAIDELKTSYLNLKTVSLKKVELKIEYDKLLQEIEKLDNELKVLNEKIKKLETDLEFNSTENKINEYNDTAKNINTKGEEYNETAKNINTKGKKYNEIDKNETDIFYKSFNKLVEMSNNLSVKTNVDVDNFNKDNTPEISELLKARKKFVEDNKDLKNIIDDQNKHFNEINNFIISRFDTGSGGSQSVVMNWFVEFINNKNNFTSNNADILQKITKNNTNNQCKQWDQEFNKLITNCEIKYKFLYDLFKEFHNRLERNSRILVFNNYKLDNQIIKNIETVIKDNRYLVAGLRYSTTSTFANIFHDTNRLSKLNTTSINDEDCVVKGDTIPGHVIVITGSDDNHFTIKNSWGYDWGDFGKLKINKNVFLKNLCVSTISTIDMVPTSNIVPIKKGGISKHKYQTKRNRRIKAVLNRKKFTKKIYKRKKTRRNKNQRDIKPF